ncbi:MAG: hemin uptake protein HemP [Rhizobiaceae bacterium]|nr:hemin uptake protein HemP [Rhizobiaceae bacterium]
MNAHINRPAHDRSAEISTGARSGNHQTAPAPKSVAPSGNPIYSSQNLFGSTNEIGIEHAGFFYRLRITKQGKLILNK